MKNLALALILAVVSACAHAPTPQPAPAPHHKVFGANFGKQKAAITLTAGNNNNLAIGAGTGNVSTLIRLTADAGGTSVVTGMDSSLVADGDWFIIRNESATASFSITNADGGSTAANDFTTANAATIVVPPKMGVMVWYDSTNGWNVYSAASGSQVLSGLTLGAAGTTTTQLKIYSQSLTPVATAAAIGTTQQTFTVTGLATTDKIYVDGPVPTSLCPMTNYRVSATNTLQADFTTLTAVACTPAAGTYLIYAIH